MISRRLKSTFYSAATPLMRLNACRYRWLRAPREGQLKVHLGPGRGNYITGWVNLDANIFTARCDVWADLRHRLPFHDSTVDAFYSHHVVEHLPNLTEHFRDAFRCLRPGGVYRVGGPNGDMAIKKFVEGDVAWFGDETFPDRRKSLGGKFENFIFCRQEHLTILTYSFLEELMIAAGFARIDLRLAGKETGYPALFAECMATEHEDNFEFPHTLIVEAVKP
jgi:SAM-dependent methyltransferase